SVMAGRSSNSSTRPETLSDKARRIIFVAISSYWPRISGHVSAEMPMGGKVKFTSGKTLPAPICKPKPHCTGCGAWPNTNSFTSGMARVRYREGVDTSGMRCLCGQTARQGHCGAGVFAVAVGTDLAGILRGNGSTANHHLYAIADTGAFERFNRRAHGGHGHRQQSGQANEIGSLRRDGLDELFRSDVRAEIRDFKAATFQHRRDQILADVMQVAFDGADHHAASRLGAGGCQQWPENIEGRFHGPAGEKQIRNEILFTLEAAAHLVHRRDHVVRYKAARIRACGERGFRDLQGSRVVTVQDRFVKIG